MSLIDEVETQRHHVVVDSYSATWNELIAQYTARDLEISPAYQRAFRWNADQQTQYIESLLLNIPTPPLFLAEKGDGKFEVIDGLQRFSTIIKFFAEEVFGSEIVTAQAKLGTASSNFNNVRVTATLTSAPILTGLADLDRATLPETLVRTLRYSRIQVILLKKESSELARYNVFTRLNRAGTELSNQEIRNCSARLFDSEFPDILMRLATLVPVRKSLGLSSKESSSMGIQENILRLISFGHFLPKTKSIEDFLDDVMYQVASGAFVLDAKILLRITDTFNLIANAFPKGEAFKFRRNGKFSGQFSPNLFDIVACGVYKNLPKIKKLKLGELQRKIVDLHTQDAAMALTGAGSNTRAKMIGRADFGKHWFK